MPFRFPDRSNLGRDTRKRNCTQRMATISPCATDADAYSAPRG